MRASLKSLVGGANSSATVAPEPAPAPLEASRPQYRTARTRADTRQVSGHFKAEVAQMLRLIAVEQDRDIQEILAEALNMVFSRYGKVTRAEVTSGRRKKSDATG